MTSGEFSSDRQQLTELLQHELDFVSDETGEWIINDELESIGDYSTHEAIDARIRVSADGALTEIGARVEDLNGMLELYKIGGDENVQDVAWMAGFWPPDSPVRAYKDNGWLYVGMDSTGVRPEHFEMDMYTLSSAYSATVWSGLRGMTYEEAKQDEWQSIGLRAVEKQGNDSRGQSVLFRREEPEDEFELEDDVGSEDEEEIIKTTSLAGYPIDTYEKSVRFAKSTFRLGNTRLESDDTHLRAHNGAEEVAIYASNTEFEYDDKRWLHEKYEVALNIPEGVAVEAIAACANLAKATVKMECVDSAELCLDYDVVITVDDDNLHIQSTDGQMELHFKKPVCEECGIPNWQFPWPDDEKKDRSRAIANMGGGFCRTNTSLGIYRCLVRTPEESHTYCYECMEDMVTEYAEEFPLANRANAITETRRKLDEIGYSDVEVMEDQVWRSGGNSWTIYTRITYERDGKTITRYTGVPQLTDQGDFLPNMQPREFVDFRYAV